MATFVDQVTLHLRAGHGGNGCVSVRREKFNGGVTAGPIGRDVLVETMKRDPSRRSDRYRKMASR